MAKKIVVFIVALLSSIGVATAQKGGVVPEIQETEARVTDAEAAIHALPVVCKIRVKQYDPTASWCKQTDFNKFDQKTGRFTDYWYLSYEDAVAFKEAGDFRNYGMFRSQQYHQCDIIIAPVYNFRTASKDEQQTRGASFVITISGYAADFYDFKDASMDDLELVEKSKRVQNVRDVSSQDATVVAKTK